MNRKKVYAGVLFALVSATLTGGWLVRLPDYIGRLWGDERTIPLPTWILAEIVFPVLLILILLAIISGLSLGLWKGCESIVETASNMWDGFKDDGGIKEPKQ